MTVSGFSFIRNGVRFDYPFLAAYGLGMMQGRPFGFGPRLAPLP